MAITKVIDLDTTYAVGAGKVSLTVIIGDAQIGQSIALLDNDTLATGDIDNLSIGTGPKIKEKHLIVKSIVTDVNDNTNKMSVTYQLRGGVTDQDFVSKGAVDNQGDSMVFRANFAMA